MARTATAVAEFLEDEQPRRNMLFRVNAKFLKDPPSGSKVYLRGNFKAEFNTSRPDDQKLGWNDDIPLTPNGDNFECTVHNLIVGATYECKFRVVFPGGAEQWFPPQDKEPQTVKIEPEIPKSPSPTTGVQEVRVKFKRSVVNILEAARSGEEAQGLEALFDQLKIQMDTMGILDDQTPLILELAVEVIRETKTFPFALRAQFTEKQAIKTFAEFQRRMEAGSKNYRRQVFNALKADRAAREKFGLDAKASYNSRSPLGNPEFDRVFDRFCSEKDLSAFASRLEVAIKSVANVRSRSTRLDSKRQRLLQQVIDHLTPEEKRAAIRPTKRAKLQELGIQAGVVGLGMVSLPAAVIALLGKLGVEGLSGVHLSDIGTMSGSELGRNFLKNNILSRWKNSDETLGRIVKDRLSDWGKRLIPLWGAKYAGEGRPEGADEVPEGDPEVLIRAACEKAIA